MLSLVYLAVVLATETPESFAAHIDQRARDGWKVVDLDVEEDGDRDEIAVAITMAKDVHAERHTILFGESGTKVIAARREPGRAPAEPRVYPGAADLLRALASGAPKGLYFECGDVILQAGKQSVLLSEREYYVVTREAHGAEAPRLLAEAMTRSLAAGRGLAAVDAPDEPGERFADFVFVDSDRETVHAELDADGHVIAVEVRHSPSGVAWQTYRGGRRLAKAIRGRAIDAVEVDEQRVRLMVHGRAAFVIDLDDVDLTVASHECPC